MSSENLFPDLHQKMSKKIAQLTKVIFHLNSKNEDNQDDLSALADAYESEIDSILRDCSGKINKFKDRLDERKAVEREQKCVDELAKRHEEEKKEALLEWQGIRKDLLAENAKLKKQHEAGVKMMVKDIEGIKSEFKKRVDAFNETVKKLEKRGGSTVEDMKAKHQREIADHVKEANLKV
mmetsp:Transcript_29642/g.74551  ORF Transcript_29642/g.74551 Transcript_29642/m.74551 type:complete len:180 (+) Transcript_29642:72-611(+)